MRRDLVAWLVTRVNVLGPAHVVAVSNVASTASGVLAIAEPLGVLLRHGLRAERVVVCRAPVYGLPADKLPVAGAVAEQASARLLQLALRQLAEAWLLAEPVFWGARVRQQPVGLVKAAVPAKVEVQYRLVATAVPAQVQVG